VFFFYFGEIMEENNIKAQKEALMAVFSSPQYRPMKLKELAILLDVKKEDRDRLKEVLDLLLLDGKIGISSKGKYGKPEISTRAGIFLGNAKGFGFVTVEGEPQDYYIPKEYTLDALHGDRVQIAVLPAGSKGNPEARVLRVLEHANEKVVGTYQAVKSFGFVLPDNTRIGRDIFIPDGASADARDGMKVVARITDFGGEGKNPQGEVVEVLGNRFDKGVDVMSVIRGYDIPVEFPEKVLEQLKEIPDTVNPKDLEGRLDLRDEMTFTIDGIDAKDLDDAISLKALENGYELGVHIADVSQYVRENSPLDREARKRGTSVYFVDRVVPMLPEKLSNGICSLNAGVDRLALSCIMRLDANGVVTDSEIAETVIRVDKRMDYHSVAVLLEDRRDAADYERICTEYAPYREQLERMLALSKLLRARRMKRGAINFDFPESKIVLDERGRAVDILPYERNCATMLIEDFMLAANEAIAETAYWQQLPFLYRNHEKPAEEKMVAFASFLGGFGYTLHLKDNQVHPKELQKLLEQLSGTEEEALISRVLLRSMKQASYSPERLGHFGLSAKYYTHFTSPIRRYPDLQIHRILKESLHGGLTEERQEHYNSILGDVGESSSRTERRADEAERQVDKIKKAEYMRKHLGEVFEGVISGVTSWGLYVELPNTVEGMVRVSDMDGDYYVYDEAGMCLVGEMSRRSYGLGERVRVVVADAQLSPPQIDFRLYESPGRKGR
jgi:ribonuclease R